jgi:hypothetical protein
MSALANLLHLLLCQQPHVYDMMQISHRQDGRCYFYLESDISDGDMMPDHEEWRRITENFKASLNFNSDEEALKFVKEAVELSQKFRSLSSGYPQRAGFIKTILS